MDQRGWPTSETKNRVGLLVEAKSKFGYWGQVASRQAARVDREIDGDLEDSSDEDKPTAEWDEE